MPQQQFNYEEVKRKKEKFQKELYDDLKQKLQDYQDETDGKKESKTGKKTERASKVLDAVGTGVAAIPVVGNFIAIGFKLGQIGIEIAGKYYHKNKAKVITKQARSLESIDNILLEVSCEAARVYEYQITILKEKEIYKVALYAAKKIMKYCYENRNIMFNRNNLLEALVSETSSKEPQSIGGKIKNFSKKMKGIFGKKKVKTLANEELVLSYLFSKPGLRKEEGSGYMFYTKEIKEGESDVATYGYRSQIMLVGDEGYQEHSLDQRYTKSVNFDNEHANYQPIYRIVSKQDILEYKNSISQNDDGSPIIAFNEFIARKCNIESKLIAVYRGANLRKEVLTQCNFDDTDFINIDFSGATLDEASLINSNLLMIDMKEASLRLTQLAGANLHSVLLYGSKLIETNFREADLSYAQVDEHTTFTYKDHSLLYLAKGLGLVDGIKVAQIKITSLNARPIIIAPYLINPDKIQSQFIEREKKLDEIKQNFQKQNIVIVFGDLGTGKSTIAYEYGKQSKNTPIWFFASSSLSLLKSYIELAKVLEISDLKNDSQDTVMRRVNSLVLSSLQELLFIFDNVECYEDIRSYVENLPKNVKLLITTTRGNLMKSNNIVEVTTFTEIEAREYLIQNIDGIQHDAAAKLISATGTTPKYLALVIGYFKNNEIDTSNTIEKHIENIKANGIFECIVNNLIEKSPIAWNALQYTAYINSEFIPVNELLFDIIKHNEVTSKEKKDPVKVLQELSLINIIRDADLKGVKVHKIIQDECIKYTKSYPKKSLNKEDIIANLLEILNSKMPLVEKNRDDKWEEAKKYMAHVAALLPKVEELQTPTVQSLSYAQLLTKLGAYYELVTSEYTKVLNAYEKAKETGVYSSDSVEIADLCYAIGRTYNALQFSEVASFKDKTLSNLENALRIYKFHKNDVGAARAENIIGHTLYMELHELCSQDPSYRDDKKIEEILTHYDGALSKLRLCKTQNIVLDMAESIDNIGLAYALFDREKTLSSERKQILISRRECLGVSIDENFKSFKKEALIYANRALEIRESSFPNHPKVAESYYNKGFLHKDLYDNGQDLIENLNEALKCFTKAKDINEKLYGINHPEVSDCLYRMGTIHEISREYVEALKLFEQALLINEKLYGKIHIEVAQILSSMVKVYNQQGEKSKELYYKKELKSVLEQLPDQSEKVELLCTQIAILEKEISTQKVIDQESTDVQISGSGLSLYYREHKHTFGYSNTFNKYYNIGIDKALALRVNDEKIGLIEAKYCLEDLNIVVQKVDIFFSKGINAVLAPCNIDKRHWIGLVFEKLENNIVSVKYIDSENNKILLLEEKIKEHLNLIGYQNEVVQIQVESQLANNCGPEVIENFMLYLTGNRYSQEESVKAHSQLYEQYLLESKGNVLIEESIDAKEDPAKYPTLYLGYEWIENKVTSAIVSTVSNTLELAVSTANKIEGLVRMCIPGEQPDWNIAQMLFYTDLLNFAMASGGTAVPFSRRPNSEPSPDDFGGYRGGDSGQNPSSTNSGELGYINGTIGSNSTDFSYE